MPEIGEVARVVHYLRKHLVGRRIISTLTQEDDIVYGKVGTSATAFKKAMDGKMIVDVGQQGKYFWIVADSPPHSVMHLGMTGWIRFSADDTSAYYKPRKEEPAEWPPKYWKWIFKTDGDNEVAFVDPRRLARIRLVDVAASELRKTSPLKENGPDPIVDKDILTAEWLGTKMRSKRVPIKALLLDQGNISGVGNWVADEVLYQARIHPEQYSNTFSDAQVETLHDSLMNVCGTAVSTLSDSSQFPMDWIMKHRWNKGKKDSNTLPDGEKITHITVGGRTSAVVLSRQKKTGPVPEAALKAEAEAGVAADDEEEDDDEPTPKARKRKSAAVKAEPRGEAAATPNTSRKRARKAPKQESEDEELRPADSGAEVVQAGSGRTSKPKTGTKNSRTSSAAAGTPGRRRSARLSA